MRLYQYLLLLSLFALLGSNSNAAGPGPREARGSLNAQERAALNQELPWLISRDQKHLLLSGVFQRHDLVAIQDTGSGKKSEGEVIRFSVEGIVLFDGTSLKSYGFDDLRILSVEPNGQAARETEYREVNEFERAELNAGLESTLSISDKQTILAGAMARGDRVILQPKTSTAPFELAVERVTKIRAVVRRKNVLSVVELSRCRILQILPPTAMSSTRVCYEAYAIERH